MILLDNSMRSGGGRQIIALFGVGLVGGAILEALRRQSGAIPAHLPLSWRSSDQRMGELARIAEAMQDMSDAAEPVRRVDVIWAAGRAGFSAGNEELMPETGALQDIVQWSAMLTSRLRNAELAFHLLSSAGGLFEGRRFVEAGDVPEPLRAYGRSKLDQEALVASLGNDIRTYIYRPSSVYGLGGRAGLLTVLIENAITHRTSRIFGGLDTVRDYVLVSDVGRFIARRIAQPAETSQTYLLASGKPSSVSEIIRIAGYVLRRPLYLKLDLQPSNANHITYRSSALPVDWRPTDLETGIRLVARRLSGSFEGGLMSR